MTMSVLCNAAPITYLPFQVLSEHHLRAHSLGSNNWNHLEILKVLILLLFIPVSQSSILILNGKENKSGVKENKKLVSLVY